MNEQKELMVGTLVEPVKRSRTLVIIIHGLLAHRDQSLLRTVASSLGRAGIASYRFDFSGNGSSEGRFEDSTPEKMLHEIEIVISSFQGRYAKVFLFGHCLGGTLALLSAARPSIHAHGLVLVNAPLHLGSAMERFLTPAQRAQLASVGFTIYSLKRPFGEVPYTIRDTCVNELLALDPLAIAPHVRCPALLVHGTADALVPVSDCEELFEQLGQREILLVGGADHNFTVPAHQDTVAAAVTAWVKKQAR